MRPTVRRLDFRCVFYKGNLLLWWKHLAFIMRNTLLSCKRMMELFSKYFVCRGGRGARKYKTKYFFNRMRYESGGREFFMWTLHLSPYSSFSFLSQLPIKYYKSMIAELSGDFCTYHMHTHKSMTVNYHSSPNFTKRYWLKDKRT